MTAEFRSWGKIARYDPLQVVITEKIDGSNACIIIEDGQVLGAQSRKRLITPEDDNFGFAAWVHENREALGGLGEGHHFGEWAGPGIQKNPLGLDERTLFLFNYDRYEGVELPDRVEIIPVLFRGPLRDGLIDLFVDDMRTKGKEGVVVYHCASGSRSKHTVETPTGKWAGK
jgi:hypothetical protein